MPSMTALMSAIRRVDSEMPAIVATMVCTVAPPCTVAAAASADRRVACSAVSALWRTVPVSTSIEAAVCCSLLAWVSVRWRRSRLAEAISAQAFSIQAAAAALTSAMATPILPMVPFSITAVGACTSSADRSGHSASPRSTARTMADSSEDSTTAWCRRTARKISTPVCTSTYGACITLFRRLASGVQ